jgi:phosphate transport system substrate-binding protein
MIKIAGSTTVLPIASRAAETLNAKKNHSIYTVNAGGSGVGIHGVGSGLIQLGLISRNITEAEKERYSNVDLKVHLIGRDAVACVVSSEIFDKGVKSLTRQQIKDIYLGKIKNWKEVGGPDRRIVVIDKEMHRGTRHVFMQYVFGRQNARAPGARLVTGSNNEEQTKLSQSDAAIGMLSFAWVNEDVVAVAIRNGSTIIEPSLKNIQNETYPIMRNLSLVTAGNPSGTVKDFISFILSSAGQNIVREAGYVPTDAFKPQKLATAK